MREIKFRGKNIHNNKLAYGYLVKHSYLEKYYIYEMMDNTSALRSEVIPESIGQFTGLKDKNGKEIYEGKESVKLIIKGCGEGLADIVMYEGKWCVFEKSQGYAPLFDLLNGNSTEIISLDPR